MIYNQNYTNSNSSNKFDKHMCVRAWLKKLKIKPRDHMHQKQYKKPGQI